MRGGTACARGRRDSERLAINDEADWIVVPNAHEPVIARSTFDRAQELTKARGRNQASKSFRCGSGMRLPYLLSGLVTCSRCGRKYQGRTVSSTKRRADGSKIKTLYYACGGYVMKGPSVCRKFLIRKEQMEDAVLDHRARRLAGLQSPEGEALLRGHVATLIAEQGGDPRRKIGRLHERMRELDSKAGTLLDAMTSETVELINRKLRDIAAEKRRCQRRLDELQTLDFEPIDPEVVVRDGLGQLRKLPRLLAQGSLEERKALANAFVVGITVEPRDSVVRVRMRRFPLLSGIASTDDAAATDILVGASGFCVA